MYFFARDCANDTCVPPSSVTAYAVPPSPKGKAKIFSKKSYFFPGASYKQMKAGKRHEKKLKNEKEIYKHGYQR